MTLITGYAPLHANELLAGAVKLDVVVSRIHAVDTAWSFDLCSPFWRLYRNHAPGAWLEVRGRPMRMSPDLVYLVPAGLNFRTGVGGPQVRLRQDYIHFMLTGYPSGQLRRLFPVPLALAPAAFPAGLLEAWQDGLERQEAVLARRLHAGALVHVAMALAFEGLSKTERERAVHWLEQPAEVGAALRLIEEQPHDPPSVPDLARACGLGERQLRRRFQEAVGMGPKQYAMERRLVVAAEALAKSDQPVEDIAAEAGFADRFGFSRAFRAQVGVPPAAYRAMNRSSAAGLEDAKKAPRARSPKR